MKELCKKIHRQASLNILQIEENLAEDQGARRKKDLMDKLRENCRIQNLMIRLMCKDIRGKIL